MKHQNDGNCEKCNELISRYDGFYYPMLQWFKMLQKAHPEAHISCAGRGRLDQEACLKAKTSRAHYGQSAHNYNAALDFFCNLDPVDLWPPDWFEKVIGTDLPVWLSWYGAPDAPYHELPHVEVTAWKSMRDAFFLKIVE